MHRRNAVPWISVWLVAALASATVATAQFASATAGGTLEIQIVSPTRLGRNAVPPIDFVWHPAIEADRVAYQVTAECRRSDRLGAPPGTTNRVRFDLSMTPLESGEELDLGRQRRKLMRDGVQSSPAVWDSGEIGKAAAAGFKSGVLVRLDLSVRGRLGFGDTVSCECRVSEQGRGIAAAGAAGDR